MLDCYLVGFLSFVLLSVFSDWALTECQNWHENLWAQEEGGSDKIIVCSPKGFLSFWIQKYCLSVLQPQSTSKWDPSSAGTPLDTESWMGKLQEWCFFFFVCCCARKTSGEVSTAQLYGVLNSGAHEKADLIWTLLFCLGYSGSPDTVARRGRGSTACSANWWGFQ